ncbi:uncharacterized protein LOC111010182 [Momordica charantia]|uniref:Uncharacterized protein LOC111010182 n=1 Tax=Momordica charantia TaxID=3673 RepID=A0A6J1CF63_MOMCH|nr:uncharacterized protein LOC111010182 [Momordica charantia]
MEEIFGVIDGRFRVSIVDSTMMSIVHRAMDKAHGRVKSREGVLERLHEISKFYELSVMQLDGCIMFVQEETDSHNPESGHEEVLAGLAEIRNRLQRRLYESELAILQKDRELRDRFESESKLRQALEITERELVSSQEDLEIERTRSAGSSNLSHQSGEDDNRDGEFCELKDSVDRQVWKIREKLEVDDYEPEENKRNHCMNDVKVEEVGSDIDMLKETLDMAFGKMQSAIFYSEMGPIEQQIKSSIENDIISINLRGFVRDSQEDLEAEVRRKEKQQISVSLNEHWTDLMNEVTGLCEDLKPLIIRQNETQPQDGEECDISDFGSRSPKREKNSAEYGININEKELEDEGSHDVAKMIENHESVISEKSAEAEEQIRLRQEILGLSSRRGGNPVSLESRIQRVLEKQENIIILNAKVNKIFGQHGDVNEEDIPLERKEQIFTETDRQKSDVDTLTDVWGKMHKLQDEEITGQIRNQISMLMQEREEKEFQNIMMEEIYITIFKGLIERFGNNLRSWELEIQISDGICRDFIRNMFNQQNEAMESYKIEVHIKDDIYYGICRDFIRDVFDQQNETMESYKIEAHIKDDIYYGICRDFIRDVFDQQNETIESYKVEAHIKDDIYYDICRDFIKNVFDHQNETMENYKIDAHIKDDIYYGICRDFIKNVFDQQNETMESYKIEAHIKDDMYYGICRDFIKNVFDQQNETMESYKIDTHIKDNIYYGICTNFIKDVFDQHNETMESYKIEAHVKDDIYYVVLNEAMKGYCSTYDLRVARKTENVKDEDLYLEGLTSDNDLSQCSECEIRSEIYGIPFAVMLNEWQKSIGEHTTESLLKEEVSWFVFGETIKSITYKANQCPDSRITIEEDVCSVFYREMVREWEEKIEACNLENSIREEICYAVLIQAEREVRNRYKRADVPIQDSDAAEKPPSRKRRDKGFSSLESLVQKLDLLSEGIDVDENLVLSASFEIKDYNSNLKLVVFECGFDESKTTFVESKVIECILASLSNKLEKTMEQINNNKLILRKLKSSLETIVSQPEKDCLISPVQENILSA